MHAITLLYHISELQAFLVACYYCRYLRGSFMGWFVPFLGFVFFADVSVYVQYYVFDLSKSIYLLISIYLLLVSQGFFYGYIFYKLTDSKILQSIIFFMLFVCIPAYVVSFFLENNDSSKYMIVTTIVSNIFLSVIALFYLYLIAINNDSINLLHEPSWWLATGVAVFFSCVSIGFLLYDFILQNNLRLFGMYLYNLIPRLMSLILYSFISISIVLYARRVKQKPAFE
jgi:hypothetical protein